MSDPRERAEHADALLRDVVADTERIRELIALLRPAHDRINELNGYYVNGQWLSDRDILTAAGQDKLHVLAEDSIWDAVQERRQTRIELLRQVSAEFGDELS